MCNRAAHKGGVIDRRDLDADHALRARELGIQDLGQPSRRPVTTRHPSSIAKERLRPAVGVWLSPITVIMRHFFAAASSTKAAASKTKADTDTDALHHRAWRNLIRRRTGRTAFDNNLLGRRSALRPRSIQPFGRRRHIYLYLPERQRRRGGAGAGRRQRNIGRLHERHSERGVGTERTIADALLPLARR